MPVLGQNKDPPTLKFFLHSGYRPGRASPSPEHCPWLQLHLVWGIFWAMYVFFIFKEYNENQLKQRHQAK